MPRTKPHTKKGHKRRIKRRTLKIKPHIESYQIIKNTRLENGILYNDKKKIIYNPDIAPYPIEQERHYMKPVYHMGLEKHVHFNPYIQSYPIKPRFSKGKSKKNKIPKDSLLLYRKKLQR
jgi:hypothetical protein